MSRASLLLVAVISSSLGGLAGCASPPTTGDIMRGHATDAQSQATLKDEIAREWEKGRKLVASGESRVKDGEKRVKAAERNLKRGQRDIEQGREEIAEGLELMSKSERRFREHFPGLNIRTYD